MSDDPQYTIPSQKDIEKDLGDYLSRKYGERVKILGINTEPVPDGHPPAVERQGKKYFQNFTIKPEELIDYLNEYVIRQEEAKAILATKICTHFNRIRHSQLHQHLGNRTVGHIKNNVLLVGPTGVGKTFLIKLIARRLGVPFVKGDATKFSETGYVGGDVEDLVRDLVREADNDINSAQFGIIYIDEVDKIAASASLIGPDVSRGGVQRALLKPMEETEVDLKAAHDPVSQIEAIEHFRATGKRQRQIINTKNILFIMSGAFNEVADIVKKRVQQQGIGFEGAVSSKKDIGRFLKQIMAEDLIEYGFESEFIGRLPVVAILDALTVDDLYQILLNPNNSIVVGKKIDFRSYGISIQFTDDALHEVAGRAHEERTGARGLVSVMEKILLPFEKKLPSTEIRHLVVTREVVNDPRQELALLLSDPDRRLYHTEQHHRLSEEEHTRLMAFIARTQKNYLAKKNMEPTPARLAMMARMCQEEIMAARDVCKIFSELVRHIDISANTLSNRCGLRVTFSAEAVDALLAKSAPTVDGINTLCKSLFSHFEYGLDLLRKKKSLEQVEVPASGIHDPDQFINNLVTESFRLDRIDDVTSKIINKLKEDE